MSVRRVGHGPDQNGLVERDGLLIKHAFSPSSRSLPVCVPPCEKGQMPRLSPACLGQVTAG